MSQQNRHSPAGARPPAVSSRPAAHVTAALQGCAQPAQPKMPRTPPTRVVPKPLATHVAAAVGRSAQPKLAPHAPPVPPRPVHPVPVVQRSQYTSFADLGMGSPPSSPPSSPKSSPRSSPPKVSMAVKPTPVPVKPTLPTVILSPPSAPASSSVQIDISSGSRSRSNSSDSEEEIDPNSAQALKVMFPRLDVGHLDMLDEPSARYNCHAWTIGITDQLVLAYTKNPQTMRAGLEEMGYTVTLSRQAVHGADALWYGPDPATIEHSARRDGSQWSSKLGNGRVIRHTLKELEGGYYGRVQYWVRLARQVPGRAETAPLLGADASRSSSWCCCFLTTACVEARGLPDDCEELTVLRAFRDGYLSASDERRALVERYYEIAPGIVDAIAASPARLQEHERIYDTVAHCVELIRQERPAEALNGYRALVETLEREYLP